VNSTITITNKKILNKYCIKYINVNKLKLHDIFILIKLNLKLLKLNPRGSFK